jgi:hypothetical protein
MLIPTNSLDDSYMLHLGYPVVLRVVPSVGGLYRVRTLVVISPDVIEVFLICATTGSFLYAFLGIDTLTVIMLPILSVPSPAYLASFV